MAAWFSWRAKGWPSDSTYAPPWHQLPWVRALFAGLVVLFATATAVSLARGAGTVGALLAASPVAGIGAWLLLTRRAWLLAVVLVMRPPLDPVFGTVSGGGLGPGAVINALVLVMGVLAFLAAPRRSMRLYLGLWLPFLVLLGLGTWASEDRAQAMRLLLNYLSCFAMFMLPTYLVHNRTELRRWLNVVVLASLVPTVAGLWDLLTGGALFAAASERHLDGQDWAIDFDEAGEGIRIQGAFMHPNMYAYFLVSVLAALLLLIRMGATRWAASTRAVAWGYGLVQLVMLLTTRTRGAWVVAALMLISYALFVDRRLLKYVALSTMALPFVPAVRGRVLDLIESGQRATDALDSYQWRQAMWESAWPWIQERWATGWGLDTFNRLSTVFFTLEPERGFDAHNVYVQMAFEAGVFTSGAYALVFLGLLFVALAAPRQHRTASSVLSALALGYLLSSYSDNMHRYLVVNWYWFFMMGLLGAILHERLPVEEREPHHRWYSLRPVRPDEVSGSTPS
jgi:O-antigen ligase